MASLLLFFSVLCLALTSGSSETRAQTPVELNAAIRDGKKKLIVIHGVGEGILREEVRKVLQFYDNVQFHDADMRKYGVGATEVIILRSKY